MSLLLFGTGGSVTLLAAYSFDEASGNILDSSGNARTVTFGGSLTRVTGHTSTGLSQSSAAADSAGPSLTGMQTAAFTIMGWVRRTVNSPDGWLMEYKQAGSGDRGFLMSAPNIQARVKNVAGTVFTAAVAQPTAGTAYHAAATCDGSTVKLFINGAEVASTAFSGGVRTNSTSSSFIDGLGTETYLDDARYYDTALDAATITSLMGTPVSSAGGTTPVTSSRATTWRVAARATSTRAATWDVLAARTATRAATWDALVTVTATRATTWKVAAQTTAARATTWDVLASRTSTRATTWHTLARVTPTRPTTWDTLAGATGTRATTWRVRAAVSASRSTTWNVASTLTTVTATRNTTWKVAARVTGTRSATWDVHTEVSAARDTAWDTRVLVAAARATTWGTKAQVATSRTALWAVLGDPNARPPRESVLTATNAPSSALTVAARPFLTPSHAPSSHLEVSHGV